MIGINSQGMERFSPIAMLTIASDKRGAVRSPLDPRPVRMNSPGW